MLVDSKYNIKKSLTRVDVVSKSDLTHFCIKVEWRVRTHSNNTTQQYSFVVEDKHESEENWNTVFTQGYVPNRDWAVFMLGYTLGQHYSKIASLKIFDNLFRR